MLNHSARPHWCHCAIVTPTYSIIPPIFYYKCPDMNDEQTRNAIVDMVAKNPDDSRFRLVIDRGADQAEHVVYKVISQLIQDEIQMPIIVVRNFNFDKIRRHLPDIFPQLKWNELRETFKSSFQNCFHFEQNIDHHFDHIFRDMQLDKIIKRLDHFARNYFSGHPPMVYFDQLKTFKKRFKEYCFREYDYLLIGPEIGVIVIEVKHADFMQKKDFSKNARCLPDRYSHGIVQLQSIESLFRLLHECTQIDLPEKLLIRKILVTPNIKKSRYFDWLHQLQPQDFEKIHDLMDGKIIQWFSEDLENDKEHSGKCNLYTKMRYLFENSDADSVNFYESYGPIIAGLSSVVVLKENEIRFEFEKSSLLEKDAILRESSRIESQDPLELVQILKPRKKHFMMANSGIPYVTHSRKVIILTSEQSEALNNFKRQFIMGAAGTGKTIVLQEKSLRLLGQGCSVLVLSADNFINQYVGLFQNHGFDKFAVRSWRDMADCIKNSIDFPKFDDPIDSVFKLVQENITVENLCEAIKWLFSFDAVIIDDALDDKGENDNQLDSLRIAYLILMALATHIFPDRYLWIAIDPFVGDCQRPTTSAGFIVRQLYQSNFCIQNGKKGGSFLVVMFQQTMRTPENIFQAAFAWMWVQRGGSLIKVTSTPGHKVQGINIVKEHSCTNLQEALERAWQNLRNVLHLMLQEQDFQIGQFAIIVQEEKQTRDEGALKNFLFDKLRNWTISPDNTAGVTYCNLPLYHWSEVSSMEFPVVIHVVVSHLCGKSDICARPSSYRACSRATAKLYRINVLYHNEI